MAYDINYEDERFTQVEADKTQALNDLNNTYNEMVNNTDQYYQAQIDATKEWGETQSKNQQEQTDFAIEQIEQQKQQAEKDYKKEQSGAYADWKVESNRYGANAETMASQGMVNTGYGESSQVAMYNTYQNRVAQARDSYQRAVLNYDNAIKDARLQNNSVLAQIAYESLQAQLELSLQGFQYKNQLLLDQTAKNLEVDQMYYGRYQDVLAQMNHENQFNESIRQYNESMAFNREQFEWEKEKYYEALGRSGSSSGGPSKKDSPSETGGNEEYVKLDNDENGEEVALEENSTKQTGAYNIPYLRTAKDVEDYLKTYGASADGLLTEAQWKKKCEEGVPEYSQHKTYQHYLYDFVNFAFNGV